MEKEILISIDSVQTNGDGEQDTISMVTEGTLMEKNGKQYITYQESELTGFEGCTTTLKMSENHLTMLQLWAFQYPVRFSAKSMHIRDI